MNSLENRQGSLTGVPAWVTIASIAGIIIGVVALVIGFAKAPIDAWLWLLVGFVVFVGIANGMLIWAATFRVAQARWTPAVNRLGHSAIAFTPVLFVVMIILFAGARNWVPWLGHPYPGKERWLNLPSMVVRDVISVLVLWGLLGILIRWSLVADGRVARSGGVSGRDQFRLTGVATAAVMFYTVAGSILAYDFIMCLSPEWISTMFAPYFWITNSYAGLAAIVLAAALIRNHVAARDYLGTDQFRDMGNLLLGFSLFSMGLFFAQYLTIWYENLPEETFFIILRYDKGPWPWVGWTAFLLGYMIPFILLQSRRLKKNPRAVSIVAVLIVLGVALERYVLIVPSVEPQKLVLYPISLLIMLGFLGAFVLAIIGFMKRYPIISTAELALREEDIQREAAT